MARIRIWTRAAWRELFAPPRKRSEEHTSELQSQSNLVCRLLLEKKKSRFATSSSRRKRSLGGLMLRWDGCYPALRGDLERTTRGTPRCWVVALAVVCTCIARNS